MKVNTSSTWCTNRYIKHDPSPRDISFAIFCAVRWRVMTFSTNNILRAGVVFIRHSVSNGRAKAWFPSLYQCKFCLRILPTFWIIRRVVSSLNWPVALLNEAKFKWTQLFKNDAFHSFNYGSLCCDLLKLSKFWRSSERNYFRKTKIQVLMSQLVLSDMFTSALRLFAFSAPILAFQRFTC